MSNKDRDEKGTLVFDVINRKTNQLVWRIAWLTAASLGDIPLAERKARINVFVKKLLAFLPEM
ncbi:MAG: DUF4136 domain-containing protein [Gammaproteobacteria bacterium]|nr:DUF4136 domain-containing protein [Gammaproteobacteria bacterium]MBT4145679.1 DUF4136 domain-containing protein [Gammaproteobacteria bacterium]MBT5222040.1 DUF4136 domain-containing protein [Gammaproteobacteria bacterium]MBT5966906.1 DUF4136 domain-containing protein [Gammaproteobacteria bacterium]MBT6419546.1 DUF4136 domain-containing protein [Gammaproteobacteria bacterium]